MKLTPEFIESRISKAEYTVHDNRLTICLLTLVNGFVVTGESSCADPAEFNADLGQQLARKAAVDKLWAFEGYLLKERLQGDQSVAAVDFLVSQVYETAVDKGWWDAPVLPVVPPSLVGMLEDPGIFSDYVKALIQQIKELSKPNIGEKLALMHGELSEGLEAARVDILAPDKYCPEFSNFEVELADTIIRVFDLAGHFKLRLGAAILAKMAYNKTRPRKHGNKKF